MLIVEEDKTRKYEEGQIFVELTKNRGLSITNCDRLGYWCDKAHLKHFILELSNVMTDSDLFRLLGDRLKIMNKKTPHTCPVCGENAMVTNGLYTSTTNYKSLNKTYFKLNSENVITIPTEYEIDWTKVENFDDIKLILKLMYITFSYYNPPKNAKKLISKGILKVKE